ncbi:hypothetical protein FK178_15390 [Antarcticibacterium arcticum]|uniref:Uncharacterized protein n=1 Tax=Antarcticibacterium arcticum TaxID=2585771 RepID=A0A5B8YMS0_9FLAO|nr:hypothetical protein [Antarcticibacterium arcticum]QED39015.1 hypothetical protein FK178_15390 [Antarcticibacterium arcticum]
MTDKLDYAPGEIAVISGSGWIGDSKVDIYIDEDPALHVDYQHDFYDVLVDENGNWSVNFQIEQYHVGVTFYVTVKGLYTLREATTVFTDANTKITVENASGESGGSITLTATLQQSGNGTPGKNNDPIANRTLSYYLNDEFVGSAVTIVQELQH